MPTYKGSNKIGKVYKGSTKIGKIYKGSTLVYHSAYAVTYCVDSSTSYTELVNVGNSCLSPTSFTPTKSGWTFVGWREDKTASSSVLTSKSMASSAITLYAVFKQTITVTYYNNSTSASTTTGTRYYNNGNTADPSFTLAQASKSGWTARGWSTSNSGNATITYNNNTAFTRSSNVTLYGLYQQTITVTYYDNSTTAKTKTGTRYWAPAGAINPSFTLAQASVSGWTARGWSTGTSGNSSISYNNNTAFTRDSNCTLYGSYSKTITVSYNDDGTTGSKTGTAYRNYAGTVTGASFTLTNKAKSGWSGRGWSTGTAGDASVTYSSGVAFTRDSNCTLYGLYQQTITISYYQISDSAKKTKTGTRYYNSYGNTTNPKFTIDPTGFGSEWTWRGWTTTANDPDTSVTYSSISNREFSSNVTLYPLIYMSVTLSYNGNGATGGSVSAQSGYRYVTSSSSGNTDQPAYFTLAENGFSRTNYNFTGWDLGAVGTTISLYSNNTAYAQWESAAQPFYIIKGGRWANQADASYGTNGWLYVDGNGDNWGVNQGNIINNNDWDYGTFRSTNWNTQGCTNVRIVISQNNNNGGNCNVTLEGSNLGNLCNKAWGTHTGTISGDTCYLRAGLQGGSWCYIDEIYLY